MPSASSKLEKQGSQESLDPVQKVKELIEKKIRNLEKRKGKLDVYKNALKDGKGLNEDQQLAVANYDSVVATLELSREFFGQFNAILTENSKQVKKALKKEHLEKTQEEVEHIREILKMQDTLLHMGEGNVRADFLDGSHGAIKLSAETLDQLDALYQLVMPTRDCENFQEKMNNAADHLIWLVEGRSKEVVGSTYKDLRNVLQKIYSCEYPLGVAPVQVQKLAVKSAPYTNGGIDIAEETVPFEEVPTRGGPPPGMAPLPMVQMPDHQDQTMTHPMPHAMPPHQQQHAQQTYYMQTMGAPMPAPVASAISINELVTPGSFDFLQESQVTSQQEAQAPTPSVYMDPAVVSIGSVNVSPPPPMGSHGYNNGGQAAGYGNVVYNADPRVVDAIPNPPPPIGLPAGKKEDDWENIQDDNDSWAQEGAENEWVSQGGKQAWGEEGEECEGGEFEKRGGQRGRGGRYNGRAGGNGGFSRGGRGGNYQGYRGGNTSGYNRGGNNNFRGEGYRGNRGNEGGYRGSSGGEGYRGNKGEGNYRGGSEDYHGSRGGNRSFRSHSEYRGSRGGSYQGQQRNAAAQ